jgi:hypothetical protein
MAQGLAKKLSKPSGKSGKAKAIGPKRLGHRVVKPKKANLISRNKMIQKNSGGLAMMTEKNLAAKAGHLEMLAGGKNQKKKDAEKARLAKAAAKKKSQAVV